MKNKNEIRKKTDMNVKKMYKTSAWKRMFNLIFNVHFLRCNANNNWFNQRFIFIWCDLKNVSFLCSRYKSCQSVIHTFSTLRFFPLFFFLFHSFFSASSRSLSICYFVCISKRTRNHFCLLFDIFVLRVFIEYRIKWIFHENSMCSIKRNK